MINWSAIIVFMYLILSRISCVPRRKKSDITQKFHRTGEPIAIDNLIQQYENEHQKLCKDESKKSIYIEWSALDKKDLSKYCRQYLQHIIPSRTNDASIGFEMRETLHYEIENTKITNDIVLVQCKTLYKAQNTSYYMTRALEPNCVYALKSSGNWNYYIFSIIYKHCNFEDKPIMNRSLIQNRVDLIDRINQKTGQPVAKDEYLLKYELEHQEMIKKAEEKEGKNNQWSQLLQNLNLYCYQYMRKCCPGRRREGVTGSWRVQKLSYQKLNTNNDTDVPTITCLQPYASHRGHYYMIRAPETNCVYAALRKGNHLHQPLAIIFKHCDFEDSQNDQLSNLEKNMIPKAEIKDDTFKTLQKFF